MEDQLVSFETAKLAKEKGFSSNRSIYTYRDDKELEGLAYYESFSNKGGANNTVFPTKGEIICEAPTQSLLQKWLREQGWHMVINNDNKWYYQTFNLAVPYDTSPYMEGEENTYESCLEAALLSLLNQL